MAMVPNAVDPVHARGVSERGAVPSALTVERDDHEFDEPASCCWSDHFTGDGWGGSLMATAGEMSLTPRRRGAGEPAQTTGKRRSAGALAIRAASSSLTSRATTPAAPSPAAAKPSPIITMQNGHEVATVAAPVSRT